MTSLFSMRRRAEEFACAVGGQPLEAAPELRPLVTIAAALRAQTAVTPRADFVSDLRVRLLAEADELLVPDRLLRPEHRTPRERRLVAAASVAVVLAGSSSIAFAAQSALPGDALYPVKRGIEQAQAGLSLSPAGKGRELLDQANDRLVEVEGLLEDGSAAAALQVPGTLTDFTAQAAEGSDLLFGSYQDGRNSQDVLEVRSFAADGIVVLRDLARTAPAEAQDELLAAALTLDDIDEQAVGLCSSCADGLGDLQVPGLLLAAAAVDGTGALLDFGEPNSGHPVVVGNRPAAFFGPDAFAGPDGLSGPGAFPGPDAFSGPNALSSPGALGGEHFPGVNGGQEQPGGATDGLPGVSTPDTPNTPNTPDAPGTLGTAGTPGTLGTAAEQVEGAEAAGSVEGSVDDPTAGVSDPVRTRLPDPVQGPSTGATTGSTDPVRTLLPGPVQGPSTRPTIGPTIPVQDPTTGLPDPVETPVPDPTVGVTDPVTDPVPTLLPDPGEDPLPSPTPELTDPAPTLLPDPIEVPSLPPLP